MAWYVRCTTMPTRRLARPRPESPEDDRQALEQLYRGVPVATETAGAATSAVTDGLGELLRPGDAPAKVTITPGGKISEFPSLVSLPKAVPILGFFSSPSAAST